MPKPPADFDALIAKLGGKPRSPTEAKPGGEPSLPAENAPPLHENLRKVLAADWSEVSPFKLGGSWPLWGLYFLGGHVTPGPRPFSTLGHWDGGNYTLFVYDFGSPDPAVYSFDHENFDDATGTIRSSRRVAPSLSGLLKALKSERPKPKPTKRQAAMLRELPALEFSDKKHYAPALVAHDRSFALMRLGGLALVTLREDGSTERELLPLPDGIVHAIALGAGRLALTLSTRDNPPAILVFERQASGEWTPSAPLVLPEGAAPRVFDPDSIVLRGDELAVACAEREGFRRPIAFYRRAGAGDWRLESTLHTPPFGAEGLSEHHLHVARLGFGERLALGDRHGVTGGQHLVYLLERDERGGRDERDKPGAWRPICALPLRSLLRNLRAEEPFSDVAIEGSRAIIGVGRDPAKVAGLKNVSVEPYENGVGAAYVLKRDAAGAWVQTACLKPKRVAAHARFGSRVALEGGTLLAASVGATSGSTAVTLLEPSAKGAWGYLAQLPPRRTQGAPSTLAFTSQGLLFEYDVSTDSVFVHQLARG
jgi:hypothetical protein